MLGLRVKRRMRVTSPNAPSLAPCSLGRIMPGLSCPRGLEADGFAVGCVDSHSSSLPAATGERAARAQSLAGSPTQQHV